MTAPAIEPTTQWRSRIVGSGTEDARALVANPRNWRTHPKHQAAALGGMLDQVGWVQQVIVNQRSGLLVDGHLRVELAVKHGETAVPVVYVDLDDQEEALVLASLDPLSALAGQDDEQLRALLDSVTIDSSDLATLLGSMVSRGGRTDPDDIPPPPRRAVRPARGAVDHG